MTIPVGSTGLTANFEPVRLGHWPLLVAGSSPGCKRPVVRLIRVLPAAVYWKKSEASGLAPLPGHMYWKRAPSPVWSVATPVPEPLVLAPNGPVHLMLPSSSRCGSDWG